MGTVAALAVSLMLGASPGLHTLPTTLPVHVVVSEAPPPPVLEVASYAVQSVESNTELWSQEGSRRRAMASVTKVMTALLVAENADPADRITISATAAATPIGYVGQPEVLEGEVWSAEDLLEDLLVQSGNDAAVALAEHVAGSESAFVALMNARAAELGLIDTAYQNPNGLDVAGHFQSARDLISLGLTAIDSEWILRTARVKQVTFSPGGRSVTIRNTNRLIGTFPGVLGIKTGDTRNASQVLLALTDTGVHRFLTVVMGAGSHTTETAKLVAWTLTTFGPFDYLHAALAGSPDEGLVAAHSLTRLEAVLPVPDGARPAAGSTPAQDSVISELARLLPTVLGGVDG